MIKSEWGFQATIDEIYKQQDSHMQHIVELILSSDIRDVKKKDFEIIHKKILDKKMKDIEIKETRSYELDIIRDIVSKSATYAKIEPGGSPFISALASTTFTENPKQARLTANITATMKEFLQTPQGIKYNHIIEGNNETFHRPRSVCIDIWMIGEIIFQIISHCNCWFK